MSTTSASTVSAPEAALAVMPAVPEQALARQELCRFLAGCFYEPGPEFAQERLLESIVDAALRIAPELAEPAQRLARAFAEARLQDLLVDYTRLFLGAPQALASPYASVWLSGEPGLMQDSTMDLQRLYREGGFEIDPEFRDLPDHVAVELEFLYLLSHECNRARAAADAPALQSALSLRQAFLAGHLGRWLAPFVAAVNAHAQCDFYRELATFTEVFVRLEGEPRAPVTRH